MRRILLVHDDAVVRVAVQNLAAALGWQVDVACDVTEALRAGLTATSYDAAVVDSRLPDGCAGLVADALAALHPAAHLVLQSDVPPGDGLPGDGLRHGDVRPSDVRDAVPRQVARLPAREPLALLDHLQGVLIA